MYKNLLLIRGVPRLAGDQINERRGLVKLIFWIFFDFKINGLPSWGTTAKMFWRTEV
jgi:hypothetical protein